MSTSRYSPVAGQGPRAPFGRAHVVGAVAVAGALLVGGMGAALAAGSDPAAAVGSISCPDARPALAGVAIPASAQAEVDRNLALLQTQIDEANNRLRTTVGQGGPNFVKNAILGPLADKRASTLDRIAIAIGRQGTRPQGLGALATCAVSGAGGAGGNAGDGNANAGNANAGNANAGNANAGNAGQGNAGQGNGAAQGNGGGAAAVGSISCPDARPALAGVAIPASAQAEVDRNLALLQTQIDEANNRLRTTVGQGGPNFVQNAIVGPLKDKRVATLNRIATAIGRQGVKPQGLDKLAGCSVTGAGAAAPATAAPAANAGGQGNAGNGGGAVAAVGSISCPDARPALAGVAIPASAQAEVDRNLALLQTQIDEANNRLRTTVGQGGPNFVQNAIVGPLKDKRVATLNRIATAIGRQGVKPQGLDALAACRVA